METICRNCEGRGHGDGDMMFFVCPRCEGSGYEQSAQQSVQWTLATAWQNLVALFRRQSH